MVRFVRIREAEQLSGLSRETLKKMRLSGQLTEGLEWVRHNKRLVLYNAELLASFIQHRNDPHAVQRARDNYLASLLSNQKVRNRRAI
jgi:hypothetical protein